MSRGWMDHVSVSWCILRRSICLSNMERGYLTDRLHPHDYRGKFFGGQSAPIFKVCAILQILDPTSSNIYSALIKTYIQGFRWEVTWPSHGGGSHEASSMSPWIWPSSPVSPCWRALRNDSLNATSAILCCNSSTRGRLEAGRTWGQRMTNRR